MARKEVCNAEDIVSLWSRCWMKNEQKEPRQDYSFLCALLSLWAHTFQTYCVLSLLSCTIKASQQVQNSLQSKANSTSSLPFLFSVSLLWQLRIGSLVKYCECLKFGRLTCVCIFQS